MGENENDASVLKPDPANSRRRASLPVMALATALVVAGAGAAYAIGNSDLGRDDGPAPVAAEATESESSASNSPSATVGPTTTTVVEPEAAPTTTPGLLTGVPATPSATVSATRAPSVSNVSRSGLASEINQYAPNTPTYERTTAVETTTMPLPDEVQKALDSKEKQEGVIDAAPLGQGGAVIGGLDKDEESKEVETVSPAEAEGRDVDAPAHEQVETASPADPEGRDVEASAVSADSELQASEPAAVPDVEAVFEPAPVAESVTAAELDASFRAAFAPGASDAQLAAAFESGPAMIPVGRVLADGLPLLGGAVQWHLAEVEGVGDTAAGQLVITTPLGTSVVPMTWTRTEGQWQISRESTCELGLALLGGCAAA